ncbi:unnamed protein product [Parnassius mnemosyne]|uniref:DUF4455 domain-containing protein n=1 Tax=Parnassius mnemosyne TaxID=213953 RepID=A0AAV1L0U5_9NEOP
MIRYGNYSFNKKNKFHCSCFKNAKINPTLAGCTDDAAAVSVLPYQWTPRKCGSILANYLKERRESYFKILKALEDSKDKVNGDIEYKVRVLAETLLCTINKNQYDIDCIVKKLDLTDGTLSGEGRICALKEINKFILERVQDISNFKEDALRLEKERANALRNILHDHFHRIIAIGHRSSKELLQECDEKIYNINQQLLSNCAAYSDLDIQLRAQANRSMIKARSILNQLCLGVKTIKRAGSALSECSNNHDIQKRSGSASHAKVISTNTTINVKEIEDCVFKLSEEYQNTIKNVYMNYVDKLKEFYKNIGIRNFILNKICCTNKFSVSVLDQIVEETQRISGISVQTKVPPCPDFSELAECFNMISKSLNSVGKQLTYIYNILHDASHLWDAHMLRLALAQKLTLAAVEDLISKHDSIELANEITFNITFEQLVTANDKEKLQQYYDALELLLKQTEEAYLHHSDIEVGRLEEISKLHIPLANILQAELDFYINKYLKTNYEPNISEDNLSDSRLSNSGCNMKTSLLRVIFQVEDQEEILINWGNGFLESFQNNLPLLSEKLEHQIRLWVEEKSLPLKKRHSLKIMSLNIRKDRIKAARDLRLAELRKNEACLESHLGAINQLANTLPMEVSKFMTLEDAGLYPFCQWIRKIEAGMEELQAHTVDVETKRLKMLSFAQRLTNHRRRFEESLNSATDLYRKTIERQVQEARVSNVRFLTHLKLHHEGGRFSAVESSKICTALVKGGDALETCMAQSLDVLKERHTELLLQADQLLQPLQKIAEEMLKGTGKSVSDKYKQFRHKK